MSFVGALSLLRRITEYHIIPRELDQHPRLLPLQRRCWAAIARHGVEQAFRAGQQRHRRRARHVVFLGLCDRLVDDLGRAFQGRFEECLVGLELLPRIDGAPRRRECEDGQHRDDAVADVGRAPPLPLRAAEHVVGGEADQRRDDLGNGETLAIAVLPHIRRKDRGGGPVGDGAVGGELVAQGGREILRIGSLDDDRNHWAIGMAEPEQPHLLVDGRPRGSDRRAQHDQRRRGVERGDGGVGQRVAAREILAVSEDRPQRPRHRPHRRRAPDEVLVDAEAFELAV